MSWLGNRANKEAAAAAAAAAGGPAKPVEVSCRDSTNRCGDNWTDDQRTSLTSRALDEFRIRCPNCSHQFTLSEGLVEQGIHDLEEQTEVTAVADTVHGSLESLAADGGPVSGTNNAAAMAALLGQSPAGWKNQSTPPAAATAGANASDEPAEGDDSCSFGVGNNVAIGEDSKSSETVSRCYQILNWTVEELERVICDPNDRRIRKISSISQCDIEVRSEMASTKFGAPKNFCILRAAQLVNIEQCRGLLKRQLLWVLKPKVQDGGSESPPTQTR